MADTEKPTNADNVPEAKKPGTAPVVPEELATADTPKQEATAPKVELQSDTSDPKTDAAVDAIVHQEGDDALKIQDGAAAEEPAKRTPWQRFKQWNTSWWRNPKTRWISIVGIVVLLGVLAGLPVTRYNVLGLVLKTDVTVRVVDSKSGAAVSGAKVELSGTVAESGADGVAKLRVNMGTGKLSVSKKYYASTSKNQLVGSGAKLTAKLLATGHQVQVKLINKVTGKGVANVTIASNGAKAKTDKKGMATLVLASNASSESIQVSGSGYNTGKFTVDANGDVAKNTFSIVPAGKLYFLSNLSGTIDVVKTNLDGSDRQTVLAGTGSEDKYSTSLLASRDWKYLALLAKRSGTTASIYLIDTTNGDKLTTIDEGNANFNLVGWSGDKFVYSVTRNNLSVWQASRFALKSFDAASGNTLLLDQTQGSGTDQNNYLSQYFSEIYLLGDQVVYGKNWQGSYNNWSQLPSKQAELNSIGASGAGHKVVKSFSVDSGVQVSGVWINLRSYEPDGLYIDFNSGSSERFYEYDDGKVAETNDVSSDNFYSVAYPTFLLSPSGGNTFWADQRDGKNLLFTGDADAKSPKQIMGLTDYNAYGWYTDDYLLVSKDSSELYVMAKSGGMPLKITDYYKPAINYQGYGGGYGGL